MNGSLAKSEVYCVAIALGIGSFVLAKQGLKYPRFHSFLETTEDTRQEIQWLVIREE